MHKPEVIQNDLMDSKNAVKSDYGFEYWLQKGNA